MTEPSTPETLFNSSKRTRQEVFTNRPQLPGGSDNQKTEEILRAQHQKQLTNFEFFLRNVYMKFDYRINKCIYSCLNDVSNYRQIGQCQKKCRTGVEKFSGYVNSRISEMQELLNECIDKSRENPNTLDEAYRCHQIYNNSYNQLKIFIQEESMFYQ